MIYKLTATKDRAIDAFQPVVTVRAEGEAIRAFQDALNEPKNGNMYNHPDDYDLYVLGDFDDQTGIIHPEPAPRKIADGKQLKTRLGE